MEKHIYKATVEIIIEETLNRNDITWIESDINKDLIELIKNNIKDGINSKVEIKHSELIVEE